MVVRYKVLLTLVPIIWGSSFVIIKDITESLPPAWLLGIRFTIATAVLALVVLIKRLALTERETAWRGIVIGVVLFTGLYLQTIGITDTTPGKNAFITAAYCVIVPFMAWIVMKRRPRLAHLSGAILCFIGIGLISLESDFSIGIGDALTLACTVFFALQIVLVSLFSQGRNIYILTFWMFCAVAVCSFVCAMLFETPPNWVELPVLTWPALLYLSVMVSAVGFLCQNIGQTHVSPTAAGILLSLESVFGALFSIVLGYEEITVRIGIGFVIIFIAVVLSEVLPDLSCNRKKKDCEVSVG